MKKKHLIMPMMIALSAQRVARFDGGGEGGEGGEGGDGPSIEELQAKLDAAENSRKALEAKNAQILDEAKKAKAAAQQWEGLDPEQVKTMLKAFENDEEMKLIAEGKHDEVIKKRTEKVRVELESKINTLTEENEQYKAKMSEAETKLRDLILDTQVTDVFFKEGGIPEARLDVIFRAKSVWRVEDGKLTPRDENGEIIAGKSGQMTPKEWVEKLKEDAPHLFPDSVGSGGSGNRGTGGLTGIDAKLMAARKAGNVDEVRRLKRLKAKQESERE